MTNATNPTDTDYSDALAAALAYTDAVGLSDGTDRPAATAAEVTVPILPDARRPLPISAWGAEAVRVAARIDEAGR